jgi:hypothetical protein
MDKIHTPALMGTLGLWDDPAVQAHVLAPTDSHAQLQAFQAIQPSDPLLVHQPSFPAQHHVNALIAEPRTLVRDIPDPQP